MCAYVLPHSQRDTSARVPAAPRRVGSTSSSSPSVSLSLPQTLTGSPAAFNHRRRPRSLFSSPKVWYPAERAASRSPTNNTTAGGPQQPAARNVAEPRFVAGTIFTTHHSSVRRRRVSLSRSSSIASLSSYPGKGKWTSVEVCDAQSAGSDSSPTLTTPRENAARRSSA